MVDIKVVFFRKFYALEWFTALVGACYLSNAYADFYIYKHRDGTTLVTENRQVGNPSYTLKEIRAARATKIKKNTIKSKAPISNHSQKIIDTSYDSTITAISKQYGIDDKLIKAIVMVESAFKASSVSPKGARGLMQLMPATAKRYGVKNSFDPIENLMAGTEYFKYLLGLFDNNIRFALAAYNAGEGTVQRYNGIPPYKETQLYVEKVIHFHRLYSLTNT